MLLAFSAWTASGVSTASEVAGAAAAAPDVAACMQPFVDSHTLAGAVTLVVARDKILSLQAVGWADLAARRPMPADGLFWIASMTKPMTAATVMMLVDEGRVALDDPVEKFLPEFRGQMFIARHDADQVLLKKPSRPISLRDVLRHTSGMLYKSPIQEPTLDLFPLATRVRSYAMLPLQFEPGSKFLYSSAGINTAARVVEVVSGLPFEVFLSRRLLAPLGMNDTTFWPTAQQLRRLPTSYRPRADGADLEETPYVQLQYPLDDRRRQPIPGSGLFSTATDLARFCRMILGGGTLDGRRYLSADAVRQMTTTQTAESLPSYGLGWETKRTPDSPFRHGGSYNTFMRIDPARQLITILLTQHTGWRHGEGEKILTTFVTSAEQAAAK